MACPLVRTALTRQSLRTCPLVSSALTRQSLRCCPLVRTALTRLSLRSRPLVRTAFTRQSLRSRPLVRTALDTTKPSLPSDTSARLLPDKAFALVRSFARLWHGKAFVPVQYVRTARGPSKALAFPRPRHSCKVQRSPRNDSLLRTVLPLQQLAHVRPAVRARNQVDAPPVNPTYRHNRGCRSTELDALARYNAVLVTTRCYGLFYHCNHRLTYDPSYESPTRSTHPWLTTTYRHNLGYRSTILDRPSSCTQRPAPTI